MDAKEASEIKQLLLAPSLEFDTISRILTKYGFRDVIRADRDLQHIAGGPPTRYAFAEILPHLLVSLSQSPDPDMGLNNFLKYIDRSISKESILSYLLRERDLIDIMVPIFTTSQYLSDILVRNVRYFDWILDVDSQSSSPDFLKQDQGIEAIEGDKPVVSWKERLYRDLKREVERYQDYEHKLSALRRFKNLEMLKIGYADIVREEDVSTITRRISELAEVELKVAYEISTQRINQKYAISEDNGYCGTPVKFSVIALGKLGGEELNYSSDIDIIFVYEKEETISQHLISGQSRKGVELSYYEYCNALSRSIVESLSKITDAGYVFRVDTRLRPEGRISALALTMNAYRNYYQYRAQSWELQSMIKARPVAGDIELCERFIDMVHSFVFKRGCIMAGERKEKLSHKNNVRKMKEKIEDHLQRTGKGVTNVKLGAGGIRDIEFIVQYLQLEHGAECTAIRCHNTLTSLCLLEQNGFLETNDREILEVAYKFLRKVEHRLQMMHELQISTLPREGSEIAKLALRMGFSNDSNGSAKEKFLDAYRTHTESVREIFDRLFSKSNGASR